MAIRAAGRDCSRPAGLRNLRESPTAWTPCYALQGSLQIVVLSRRAAATFFEDMYCATPASVRPAESRPAARSRLGCPARRSARERAARFASIGCDLIVPEGRGTKDKRTEKTHFSRHKLHYLTVFELNDQWSILHCYNYEP